jgi:hypothetical protein
VIVRDYEPSDREAVEQLHRLQGMDYKFPDIDQPLFLVRKVCLDDTGKIIGTALCKLQCETYLMLAPALTPSEKVEAITEMNPAIEQEAYERGIDTLAAYIPADISKRFTKRLKVLGWNTARPGWVTWFRDLTGLGAIDGQGRI